METEQKKSVLPTKIKTFEAAPYAVGNSHVITIPSFNIKAGVVIPGKKYRIVMEEITEEKKEEAENHGE